MNWFTQYLTREGPGVPRHATPKQGLALIAAWLTKYRAYWPARIDALKIVLRDMEQ